MSIHSMDSSIQYKGLEKLGSDYLVGSDGSIWSKKTGTWKRMKAHAIKGGYLALTFSRSFHPMTFVVHRLVLEAFIGPCPQGMQACHGNGKPADNRLENLRWDTPKENCRERGNQGVAKLTEEDVRQIRNLYASGRHTMQKIAEVFEVSIATIFSAIRRKHWTHVEGGIPDTEGDLRVKLTKIDVKVIRYLHRMGKCTSEQLAKIFGVTSARIRQLVRK